MALAMTQTRVDPVAAATYFVERLGCQAFPVYGSRNGRCLCGDPHDGSNANRGPDNMGKHPATGHGFKNATDDVSRIRTFLSNPGTPNYGLNPPPGVLVIDVDGTKGLAEWDALQRRYGVLPMTLTTTTANGRHYFYRWPERFGPMPTGKLFGFVVRRHDDGYVIGPGSVHPTGVIYDTLRQPDGMPYDIVELPRSWAQAAIEKPFIEVRAGGDVLPEIGGRHDWLRNTARHYAGTVRDPAALKAAVMAANAKLPEPKTEAEVERAIGEALTKFPPDPTEPDPETGAPVRVPYGLPDGEHYDQLAMSAFPDPPGETAFKGLLGEVTDALCTFTDASRVGILAAMAAMAGGVLGIRGVYHTEQPSAVMTGLVGVTSEARKSTTIDLAWNALLGLGASYQLRFDGLNSGEALVSRLMKMQQSGSAHGVLVEDEFSRLLVSSRREGSTLDSMLRTAFDGRALSVFTRNAAADLSVIPPYVISAVSAITPKELRKLITPTMLVNGSVNRWLWVPVIRRPVESIGDRLVQLPAELNQRLLAAVDAAVKLTGPMPTEGLAAARLNDYGSFLSGVEGLAGDMGRRLNVIAFRVALVHAAIDRAPAVQLEHVERAMTLTEYARAGLGWVFGQLTGMREADLLARAVAAAGTEGLTLTNVTRQLIRNAVTRQEAIDAVMDLGLIRVEKTPNPAGTGRPTQRLVWVPDETWVGGVFATYNPELRVSASTSGRQLEPSGNNAINGNTYIRERETKPDETPLTDPLVSTEPVLTVIAGGSETIDCAFYEQHRFGHRQRRDGSGFFCPICDKNPDPEPAS